MKRQWSHYRGRRQPAALLVGFMAASAGLQRRVGQRWTVALVVTVAIWCSTDVSGAPARATNNLSRANGVGSGVSRQTNAPAFDPVVRAQRQKQADDFLDEQERTAPPPPATPQIVERGAHHNRWETYRTLTNVIGRREVRTNSYVELATGLNRRDAGQWIPSEAVIELVPGGAEAKGAAHKAGFGANANRAGFLEVNTPDGKRLRSHVLGLFYLETTTGRSVQITSLKNSQGAIHPPNEVVYADAFKDLKADLRYTYRLSGIEQDVILRERPPSPADYGLDPAHSQLIVMTEFVDAPEPVRKANAIKKKLVNGREVDGLQDETLEFGVMKMGPGRAFRLGEQGNLLPGKSDSSVPVGKRWLRQGGRTFLLEAVEYPDLQPFLPELPRRPQAWNRRPVLLLEKLLAACAPPQRELPSFRGRMQMASLPLSGPGLVVDYNLVGTVTNFTFQGDSTYYVSDTVTLDGTTTLEGGAVVKYSPTNTALLLFHGPLVLKTSEYRPAVFTVRDDDTVGEVIPESTGNPTTKYHGAMCFNIVTSEPLTLENLRIAHANWAISAGYRGSVTFRNLQIMNCYIGLYGGTAGMKVLNSLFANTTYAVVGDNYQQPILVENSTFNACSNVFYAVGSGDVRVTNNIFASVTTYGTYSNLTANYNGIYDSPALSQANGFTATSSPFQAMGGGGYYLPTNSAWRNVGSAAINPLTTAVIQQRTTEPPQLVSGWIHTNAVFGKRVQRDVDTPDLGYHYAALDYVFSVTALNTDVSMVIKPGVSIGVANAYTTNSGYAGVYINPNPGVNRLESAGTPTERNRFVMFNAVQESGSTLWNQNIVGLIGSSGNGGLVGGCRFTDFVVLGTTSVAAYSDYGYHPADSFKFDQCEFRGGSLRMGGHTMTYLSCLFDRTSITGLSWGTNRFQNCTFLGGDAAFNFIDWSGGGLSVHDSIFAGTTITNTEGVTHGFNGYTTNGGTFTRLSPAQTNDVLVGQAGFVAGPLGSYYLTNWSPLVNAGSQTAAAAGLYHFTTSTNQVKETNSTVDIGFHYVALNTNGLPVDTDGDGLPDYLEDRNGNGIVDTGETSWLLWSTAGNGLSDACSDLDYDGVWAIDEYLDGTDPTDPNSYVLRPKRLGLWRFNDTNWLGEQGQVPLFTTNAQNIISWNGRGLQVGTNDSWRFLTYRDVETNGVPNLNLRQGSVRFWFKPNWASTNVGGTGLSAWGRLVSVGWWTPDGSSGFWDLQFRPDGSQISFNGFNGQTNGGVGFLAADIAFHSNQWHQITLTYSPSSSALYIDGQLVQTGGGVTAWPATPMRATTGFSIGNDYTGWHTANGQFRDFETFNYPLAASEIAKPLVLGAGIFLSGGQFQLQVGGGVPGSNWTVQASSDLLNWTAVTNVTATGGNVSVVDPGAINYSYRFYRARNDCDRSVNVFGYLRKTVPTGDSMISIPLNGANNGVPYLFNGVPSGTSLFKYDPVTGFFQGGTYAFGTWGANSSLSLNPGEGVLFRNPLTNSLTLTFIGELPEGHIMTPIGTNFGLYGSAVPLGGRLEAVLGLPVANGARVHFLNNATATYSLYEYVSGSGWYPSAPPSVTVGDAFWVSGFPQGTNWIQDFFPAVAIASPYDNTVFLQPATIALAASVTNECQIAQVNYYSGTTWLGVSATSPYTLVWSNAPAGLHSLTARATDLLGNHATSRVVQILVNPQPSVTVTAPANNALIPHGDAVQLTSSATNFYAGISNVAYYVSNGTSNTLIGTSTSGPTYPLTWSSSNTTVVTNWLTARATDIYGAKGTSAPIMMLVDRRPMITLTSPTNGTVVATPGSLTLNATATDADGSITNVDFFANGNLIARIPGLAGTNYSFPWVNFPAGSHTITAVGTDQLGLSGTSASVTITNDVPPTLAFVSPSSNGMVYATPATIPVTVTATDADGQVKQVRFYHGLGTNEASVTSWTSLGTVTNAAPYTNTFSVSWTNSPVGSHMLKAVATDNFGVMTTATRTIRVAVPPTVTLTSPGNWSAYVSSAAVPLAATAVTTNGVARVEFLNGSVVVATVTNAPYALSWTNAPTGTNPISARVTDLLGLTATSGVSNVVMETPWSVSLTAPTNGTVAVPPTNVTLTAVVSSNLVAIRTVEFFRDGSSLRIITNQSPYPNTVSVVWTNAAEGTSRLTARATDLLGVVRNTPEVQLTVGVATIVSVTAPAAGAILTNASLTLSATVTNNPSSITQVQFFWGTHSLGVTNSLGVSTSTDNPYTLATTNLVLGTNYLKAQAVDSHGFVVGSPIVAVVRDLVPLVTLGLPSADTVLSYDSSFRIEAMITNTFGTVTNVAYHISGAQGSAFIGATNAGAGYGVFWSPASAPNIAPGTNWLWAVATDSFGIVGTSVSVPVILNKAPRVTLTSPANTLFTPPQSISLSATATDTNGWVTKVDFYRDATLIQTVTNATSANTSFTGNWTNAPSGVFQIFARAYDNHGGQTDSPRLTITNDVPPTLAFVSPSSNGMVYATPATIPVTVTATDADGQVKQVRFYHGLGTNEASVTSWIALGTVTNSPFSVSWANSPVGSHVLKAVATDNLGVTTTATRTVRVAVPPTVTLTSPTNGAVYALPGSIPLAATAVTTNGVNRVEFLAGTNVVGTVTNAPYAMSWTNALVGTNALTGTNSLSARVTDQLGLVSTSTNAVSVVVEPAWTVSVTTSANGMVAVAPTNVTLTASVVGNLAGIAQVEFFVNGTNSLGVDASSPYGVAWNSATAGTNWIITARATSVVGGIVRTSAPVQLIVDAPTTVSLTGVTNDSILRWEASLPLTAVATNTLVGIQQVEFFQGLTSTGLTNRVGVSTNVPYASWWTNAPAGTNYLTAVASNRLGVVTTAAVVRVVVDVPPTVSLTGPVNNQMFTNVPATLVVTGLCASANGTVTNVAIFQGQGTNLVVNLASPGATFSYAWSNVIGGVYTLRAVATDNLGVHTESAWVTNVVVNASATVTITNPVNGAGMVLGTPITVDLSAIDPENSLTNVTLYAGTNVLATWGSGPYAHTWNNAPLGTNFLRAQATDNYGVTSLSAEVSVVVASRPWVTWVRPGNPTNTVYVTPASPQLEVQAGTTSGVGVKWVEFFVGTNSLGVATNQTPYTNTAFTLTWTNPAVGTYALTARAMDRLDIGHTSVVAQVIMDALPSVVLTNPATNSLVVAPATITLTAEATGNYGTVTNVQFYSGGTLLGTGTASGSTYSFSWSNALVGTNSLTARATDNHGVTNSSAPVTLVVHALPLVDWTSPTNGTVVFAQTNLTLAATVTSLVGVTQVEFFLGTNSLGLATNTGNSYTLTWTNVPVGTNYLSIRATDSLQYSTNSAARMVIGDPLMSVHITAPTNGTVAVASTSVTLTAVATNTLVGIQQVEFFRGTNSLGVVTNSPYQLVWPSAKAGTNAITARATDVLGMSAVSAPVTLIVGNRPTIAFAQPLNNSVFLAPATLTNLISAWSQAGITQVELFYGVGTSLVGATNSLGVLTNAPPYTNTAFSFGWPEVGTNVYSLRVRATDALGITNSVGITNVVVELPPTVTLTGPTNRQVFSPAPATIPLSATATGNFGSIASVKFFAGNAQVGGDGITVNGTTYSTTWASVAPGTNFLTARAQDIYGILSTSAVVEVIVTMPPVVQITAPVADAVFQAPASIPIHVTASGAVGIERAAFFQGPNLLQVVTNTPPFTNTSFGILWTNVSPNAYPLTAQVTDVLGITGTSPVTTVVVDVPPSVTLTSPTNGTVLAASTNATPVTLNASASGNYGAVTQVRFYHGSSLLGVGVLTNDSYQLTASLQGGIYQLTAVAIDQWGLSATSSPVILTMDAPTVVTLVEPAAGSVFLSPAVFTVSATATNSNPNGTIQHVAFYDGTNYLGAVTNPPYSFSYSIAALGYRSLTARATDGYGYQWSSPPVQVVVDTPPSVVLTNPVPPATITTLDTLTLGAQATSSALAIAHVEFYQGTNYLGTSANPPYAVSWQGGAVGAYDFTAVAVDSVGVKATSAVMTVSVILPTAPPPRITPASGFYSNAVSVAITGDLLGASFKFSVDSGITWLDYLNGVTLQSLVTNVVVMAKAVRSGYYDSAVTVVVYTFADSDGDGLSDPLENSIGTNPFEPDTDNDGRSDSQELADSTNPLDSASVVPVRLAALRFMGPNWLAGERGQLPIMATNVAYMPGFHVGAARINSTNAARLAYRDVEADGTANINVRHGTIRFWFRPDWDIYYGQPTQPGRLIELGTRSGENPEGWWALRFDEQGLLYFTTQAAGGEEREHFPWGVWMPTWSSYSYGGWMQFTLTYSPTNVILYGNGSYLAEGESGVGVDGFPDFAVRHANGFSIGSDPFGNQQAQGSFDLIETYNHPLDNDTITSLFNQEAIWLAKLDTDYDGVPDQAELNWYGTDPADSTSVSPVRLAFWQFNDTNWEVNHDWGMGYYWYGYGPTFSPLVSSNLQNVASWDGNALSIGGADAARLAYRDAEEDGDPNINLLTGTTRFWFRPNWASASAGGSGPGVDARLIEVGADDASTDFGVWRIYASASGNTLGFYSRSNSTTTNVTWLVASIAWQSNVWHQVVLSHTATNQDLFVDGQRVASQSNAMHYPDLGVRVTHGISIGSDYRGSNVAVGQFDTMETFNYPMDTNQVAQEYATQLQVATLVDSDYDGLSDAVELTNGSDPLDPNSVTPTRLGYWSFNDEWQWLGDRGQWPWMPYAQAIPTMRTNGVRINATMNGYGVLAYYETEAGIANINGRNGTVSFWFKPDWDSASAAHPEGGPGHEAQLISLGSKDSNYASAWWGMSLTSQGNLLTFSAMTNGEAVNFLSLPMQWQSNRWYQLTLAYSPTGSVLYVNGQVATSGAGVNVYPDAATRQSYGLHIGNAAEGGQSADGAFDELETYNYVLTAEAIGQAYTNALASMALVDSDYDGRTDAQELADGTDPADPVSVLPVQLGHWRFDSTNWFGEQGQLPLICTNVQNVPGWSTNALWVGGTNAAQLAYRCSETNGQPNINLRKGSICFWVKPNWTSTTSDGTGPGCEARLIEVGRRIPDSTNQWWSLYTDTNGTQLTLEAQGESLYPASYLTVPIDWKSNQWHFICVTYGPETSRIYVDALPGPYDGTGTWAYPGAEVRSSSGFSIGSDWSGNSLATGIFEEMRTFNYPLLQEEVSYVYQVDLVRIDSDGDGVPDVYDADPLDSNVGWIINSILYPQNSAVVR